MSEPQETDWRFDVPPELSHVFVVNEKDTTVEQDPEEDDESVETDVIIESQDDDYLDLDVDVDPVEDLAAPNDIQIVDQQVITLVDGTQLIDLVIDIEPVVGASKYVVKYVKI